MLLGAERPKLRANLGGYMAKRSSADAIPEDIARLSFEDALAALEKIVRELEEGRYFALPNSFAFPSKTFMNSLPMIFLFSS